MVHKQYDDGRISISIVLVILLGMMLAGVGALSIWLFGEYSTQKQTTEEQINAAVAEARNEQSKEDEEKYLELSKRPKLRLTAPDEVGRVTFEYPRNWDVYISEDGIESDEYTAFLNPGGVLPIEDETNRYALRVEVFRGKVDEFLSEYEDLLEEGTVKSSVVSSNGHDGTRLDGLLEEEIRGSMVVYKVDDNVLAIRTDAETFTKDFDELITTIDFK